MGDYQYGVILIWPNILGVKDHFKIKMGFTRRSLVTVTCRDVLNYITKIVTSL